MWYRLSAEVVSKRVESLTGDLGGFHGDSGILYQLRRFGKSQEREKTWVGDAERLIEASRGQRTRQERSRTQSDKRPGGDRLPIPS